MEPRRALHNRGWLKLLTLLAACPACRKATAQGPLALVSNERDGTITVIDLATNQMTQSIAVGGRARGIRLGPDGKTIYVALSTFNGQTRQPDDDRITAIDIATSKVVASYQVRSDPEKFDLSCDGKRLYTSNEDAGTASVTDLATNNVIAAQPLTTFARGVLEHVE